MYFDVFVGPSIGLELGLEVIYTASLLGLADLVRLTELLLQKQINSSTVFSLYESSLSLDAPRLRAHCVHFILKEFYLLSHPNEFLGLSEQALNHLHSFLTKEMKRKISRPRSPPPFNSLVKLETARSHRGRGLIMVNGSNMSSQKRSVNRVSIPSQYKQSCFRTHSNEKKKKQLTMKLTVKGIRPTSLTPNMSRPTTSGSREFPCKLINFVKRVNEREKIGFTSNFVIKRTKNRPKAFNTPRRTHKRKLLIEGEMKCLQEL